MHFNRTKVVLSFLLPCVLLLAGCGRKQPGAGAELTGNALQKIRFQTDWYPQAEHGGFYQALAKGYYRDAGLDVEIISGGPGATVAQRMISGAADIGMSRSDDVALFVADGKPFVIIGVTFQHDPQAILLHEENPVNTFADLDGKTIMAVPGSAWISFLKRCYHIDFSIIPSNFGIARFMADRAFIQQCFITNEPYYVRANGGKPKTLLISDSGFDPYRVYMTTRRYARENERALRNFVAASTRGWTDFINGDPSPAFDLIISRNTQMTREFLAYGHASLREHHLVAGHHDRGETVGQLSRKRMEDQMRTLVDLKLLKEPIPLETLANLTILGDSLSQ